MNIIYFGHDIADTTLKRRISTLRQAGAGVLSFTMRRGETVKVSWDNIDLGQTYNSNFTQRLGAIFKAGAIIRLYREKIEQADIIFARNLDMLILADHFIRKFNLKIPLVYECLDIHALMTKKFPSGPTMRLLERRLLKQVSHVIISSPAFRTDYFDRYHPDCAEFILLENKLYLDGKINRTKYKYNNTDQERLKIGWFGILRCARSLCLLTQVADTFSTDVDIIIRGRPALDVLPRFHETVAARHNMIYKGPYKSPGDLACIYGKIDLTWAGDFFQAGYNSKWLLPNRLYESGVFGVPCLAPEDSMTGRRICEHELGFTLAEPLAKELPELICTLLEKKSYMTEARDRILSLPLSFFADDGSEIVEVLEKIKASSKGASVSFPGAG